MIHVKIIGNMGCVANVGDSTELRNSRDVIQNCRKEGREQEEVDQGAKAVEARTRCFPSSSKRKTKELVIGPRFR